MPISCEGRQERNNLSFQKNVSCHVFVILENRPPILCPYFKASLCLFNAFTLQIHLCLKNGNIYFYVKYYNEFCHVCYGWGVICIR